ncbi:MAG: OsmC family peroxiredoxin [Sphingobacteriales bacterium]|nr:MAG: OsmC family peroxiredoxin [Sphingobacteriales bacterium]
MKNHQYTISVNWTGNTGQGTKTYQAYSRNHEITTNGKPMIPGSSDPGFRGDPSRYNPEEMLVASISTCHMLWYLHLCSVAGIIVTFYQDNAEGIMTENEDGSGFFSAVTLRPSVIITDEALVQKATELHHDANKHCFIANSLNFPVQHVPKITVQASDKLTVR